MKKKPKKPGRPKSPEGATRSVAISVRMTPAEHAKVVELAKRASRGISDHFVVSVLGRRFS